MRRSVIAAAAALLAFPNLALAGILWTPTLSKPPGAYFDCYTTNASGKLQPGDVTTSFYCGNSGVAVDSSTSNYVQVGSAAHGTYTGATTLCACSVEGSWITKARARVTLCVRSNPSDTFCTSPVTAP